MTRPADLGLLFLHALPLDGRMWNDQRWILPEHSYTPTLYRHGNSVTQWAVRCLKDMPHSRFVVVGCSVGGSCALEILRLAPERVAATVLIGTKARHDPDPAGAAAIRRVVKTQGVAAAWQTYWRPLFSNDKSTQAVETAEHIALEQSADDLIRGLTAFHNRPSREDVVAQTQSPTHVVTGDCDDLPGLGYARHLAAMNRGAHLHVIKGCGHYTPLMRPGETGALISNVVNAAMHD
ncbi:MAG: alpha/beta hydrolase [Pseudomonadota bacterium]